jgi:hypothetical protein
LLKRLQGKLAESKQLELDRTRELKLSDELGKELTAISGLLQMGRLRAALDKVAATALVMPSDRLSKLQAEIEARIEAAGCAWDEVPALLLRADTVGALKAADTTLAIDSEHERARNLKSLAKISPTAPPRVLRPTKVGKEVLLMRNDTFIIGRDRSKGAVIVLSDDRISRAHLKLCVLGDHLVAEDMGSSGGSFVAGHKITNSYVSDGDILSLAKALQVQVYLCREGVGSIETAHTRLGGEESAASPVLARKAGGSGALQGVFLDFPTFSVLWGRMPVTFTAAGILPAKASRLDLVFKDGILLLGEDGKYRPFGLNETVVNGGIAYDFV